MPGTFVLSLDLEMAWGSWRSGRFDRATFAAEPDIARRLDRIAVERRLPFTWAVVGAIEGITADAVAGLPSDAPITVVLGGRSDLMDPVPRAGLVQQDPTAWLAPGLISELAKSEAAHEIASHTFFHALPASPAAMTDDLAHLSQAVPGVQATTLVFPRDRIEESVVQTTPITCYRGAVERPWFRARGRPQGAGKALHLMEQALGVAAPLASVRCGQPAVISSSAILTLRHGLRRRLPSQVVRRRLRASIDRAVRTGGMFHLWTHPWNLSIPGSDAFELLADALGEVADRRDRGDLDVVTMAEAARRACYQA